MLIKIHHSPVITSDQGSDIPEARKVLNVCHRHFLTVDVATGHGHVTTIQRIAETTVFRVLILFLHDILTFHVKPVVTRSERAQCKCEKNSRKQPATFLINIYRIHNFQFSIINYQLKQQFHTCLDVTCERITCTALHPDAAPVEQTVSIDSKDNTLKLKRIL